MKQTYRKFICRSRKRAERRRRAMQIVMKSLDVAIVALALVMAFIYIAA